MSSPSRRQSPIHSEPIRAHHCSPLLRKSLLHQVPFFSALSHGEIKKIAEKYRDVGYAPGETIYHTGAPVEMCYVVANGKVKQLVHSPKGQNILLDIMDRGHFFGSLPINTKQRVQVDTTIAMTHTCILSIPKNEFLQVLTEYAGVTLRVMEILEERLHNLNERLQHLSTLSVEQRLAFTLVKLAEKMGTDRPEGLLIETPLSRVDIAEMAGTTPETTSRILHDFREKEWLNSGRKWIAITNLSALKHLYQ